jgi:hypothetical protein
MFDLDTIKRINNEAVRKHDDKLAREVTLRRRLKGKIAAKKLASYSLAELENAAYYLL